MVGSGSSADDAMRDLIEKLPSGLDDRFYNVLKLSEPKKDDESGVYTIVASYTLKPGVQDRVNKSGTGYSPSQLELATRERI